MSLALAFNAPFYAGTSRSSDVPHRFDCSLNGRSYMIDTDRLSEFRRESIKLLREQADNTGAPGEQSLSVEELWRRSQDDWSHGAGQMYLDRRESDNSRFRSSKGVDVWERWSLSLLNDTALARSSGSSNLALATAGTNLYATDGTALLRTTDLLTWATVTGTPNAATSIVSDGFNVFTAHGASGIFSTTRGSGTSSVYNTLTTSVLGFVKGRLMAASGASVYNVTSGTAPTALLTQPNSDFAWVGFAEGQRVIYAAGFSGDKSLIYRIGIKGDGTGLDVPIVAGELPDGEIVRAIKGYLGYLLIGTDSGVRFALSDSEGNLTIGALTATNSAVRCFEGQDRFAWFGWTAYDSTSTGLGRLDLSRFITDSALVPAYASDLMADGQGAVLDVCTFGGRRVFAVSGQGIYDETVGVKVAVGTLDTGLITYGLPDLKTAVYCDVKVREPVDTNRAYISVDGSDFALIGTRTSTTIDPFTVGERSGETFELRMELANEDVDDSVGPVLTRYTLRAYPRPAQGEIFLVPVLLHSTVLDVNEVVHHQSPALEYAHILALRESKELVLLQIGTGTHTVLVDDALLQYSHRTGDGDWHGTCLLKLKSPAN